MKKITTLVFLIAGVLAIVPMAFAGGVSDCFVSAGGTDINFDGYCDGTHFAPGPGLDGLLANRTGCSSEGCVAVCGDGKIGYTICGLGFTLYAEIRSNHTWTYWDCSGAIYNSGTWSDGPPAAAAAGKPVSTQR